MRPYQYRCNDNSLLTPWFKKWFVAPAIKITPWIIPANIITILSNVFVYFGLILAMHPAWLGTFTPVAVAFCLLLYLIGDHVDGMQAKRTGTGSALGEFCDHYLDAFNNGIIVYTMFTIFNITNPYIVGTVMVTSYLAHMVVFYEQFQTGWLTFEKLGSLEGVLLSAILVGISAFSPVYSFMTNQLIAGFSLIEIVMISSGLGGLMTFFSTYKRMTVVRSGFWIFSGLLVVASFTGLYVFDLFSVFIIVTLYASLYIGRIMRGHLVDGVERNTDFVVPVTLTVLAFIPSLREYYSFQIIVGYLLICVGVLIAQTFSALRKYWVWSNARS